MDRIDIKTINFSLLKPMENVISSESNLFHDKKTVYKIYKGLKDSELNKKRTKMRMLEGYDLKHVIIPKVEIVNGQTLAGCSEDYVSYSTPLYDFRLKNKNINLFFKIVNEATGTLREIHDSEIVVADLNFDNIIFDSKFNHYYVDFENCALNNLTFERIPLITQNYFRFRESKYGIDYNYDRLSMLLCTFFTLTGKPLEETTQYEYDSLAERIKTLQNMKYLYKELKKRYTRIPEIPYIDELIVSEDKSLKLV